MLSACLAAYLLADFFCEIQWNKKSAFNGPKFKVLDLEVGFSGEEKEQDDGFGSL